VARRGAMGTGRLHGASCRRRVAGGSAQGYGGRKRRRWLRPWSFSPEKRKKRLGKRTDTDSRKERRAGVEKIEANLRVVTVFAGDDGDGRKSSPNFYRRSSPEVRSKTSAMDLRGYEWRLEKAIVLLESARRGLRRHIYRSRVWKSFGIS
jgi:hypothetical protein